MVLSSLTRIQIATSSHVAANVALIFGVLLNLLEVEGIHRYLLCR